MIVDNEINLALLECLGSMKVVCTKPQSIFSSSLLVTVRSCLSRASRPTSTSHRKLDEKEKNCNTDRISRV